MKRHFLILTLFFLGGAPVWSEKAKEEKGKLEVKNGDFTDLTGLQERQQWQHDWQCQHHEPDFAQVYPFHPGGGHGFRLLRGHPDF